MSVQAMTESVSAAGGLSQKAARLAVDTTIAEIVNGIIVHGECVVVGLGRFTVQDFPARMARNPRTGEPVEVPAQRKVKFRPGKALKEALNR